MATIVDALALALDHHLAGRLAEAQDLYNRILDVAPDQPDALHFLGVLAGQVGKQDLGVQLIARAIAQRPDAADMHANCGNIQRSAGRAADAVASYRRAIALRPDFAEAWTDLANALRGLGEADGPIPALERALASDPALDLARQRLGALLHERGRLLVEAGRGVDALPVLARAAEVTPFDADIAFLYGNALFALGLREDSLAAYRNALAITPDYPSAAFNLGIALGTVDRMEESAAALERTARLDPRHADAIDRLVVALVLLGREEEAVDWGDRALSLKDHAALSHAPALPALPASPREPDRRRRKVVSFSLWGDRDPETIGAVENARLVPLRLPGWTCRVYHDRAVPRLTLAALAEAGAELVKVAGDGATGGGVFWRMAVADDPTVERFLCRDCDGRLTPEDAAAVAAWIDSGKPFHVLRGHALHTEVIHGGLWGGVAGLLPDLLPLVERHAGPDLERNEDHRFLRRIVWPMIRDQALVHDGLRRRHGLPLPL